MEKRVLGDVAFVRAPAQFGRRHAFLEEAFDAPGVDEFVDSLGLIGDLGIALADVNHFDVGKLRQCREIFIRQRPFKPPAPRIAGFFF